MALAFIGAIVFDISLPVGWRYAKSFPEPTLWFSAWFVRASVWCGLLAVSILLAEPLRFRTLHIRSLRWYPPLWFSIGLAFGIAAFFDAVLPPSRNSLTPAWQRLDVLGPLGIIAMVASAWRQLPWRRATPAQQAAVEAVVPLTWDDLKRWFRREEPLQNGPDLFGHAPIAERIYNAIIQPENQAIALIGLVGSGKSSILNAVKHKLHHQSTSFTIVAEFNCWAMPRPEDAPRLALERAIDALSDVIDAQAVRRLPLSYQRILSAEPTGKLSRLVGVDDVPDAVDQLRTLTSLLEVIDARLLLIIEDAERAGQSFETRHLERLLWTLRHVDRVSFILSFDVQRASFDYPKLCDIIERVRPITVDRVEEVLAPAYSAWRTASDTYIDPISSEKRQDRLGLENVTDSTMRYLRRTHGDSAADAIAALLTSPRNLKHFIRDVDRAWDQLRGEVELNDLIVLTALRHGAPAAFDFIVDNVEAARSERKERDAFAGDAVKTIKPRWEKLRNSLAQPTMVQNLVDVLDLNQLNSDSTVSSQSSPQGIHNGEPVDYLGRILAGQLLPGEIRDQDVLRDIEMWKNARSGAMLEKLATATPESDEYVAVWRHYAHRFSFEQVIDIAGALANALLITLGANASMQHPAMGAVWRQSSRYMERDTKTAWLIEQIQTVLPTSLGFATDLFQYFGSVADGIVTGAHRAQVRAALVESARASLNTADSLLASLGSQHEVPLTRLVYPPPSDQPPDTISFSSWGWLVDLIIEAARTNEERVVPDVAVLVGDTMQGFRTGTFERRYILKRDWMTEIFGPRTDDMLHILADYHGGQEHALGARKEAKMWLAERARPSDKT